MPKFQTPSTLQTLQQMIAARLPQVIPGHVFRSFSTTRARLQSSPIPYTLTCPWPTCECGSAPPDLDIDRKTPLLNTMASYSEQVVFCTGKEDWTSNIEQEEGETGEFVKGLKGVIGKGAPGFDVGSFFSSLSWTTWGKNSFKNTDEEAL